MLELNKRGLTIMAKKNPTNNGVAAQTIATPAKPDAVTPAHMTVTITRHGDGRVTWAVMANEDHPTVVDGETIASGTAKTIERAVEKADGEILEACE